MTDLSTILVKLRKDHGLSQKQVAMKLSVSRQTYAAWEQHNAWMLRNISNNFLVNSCFS